MGLLCSKNEFRGNSDFSISAKKKPICEKKPKPNCYGDDLSFSKKNKTNYLISDGKKYEKKKTKNWRKRVKKIFAKKHRKTRKFPITKSGEDSSVRTKNDININVNKHSPKESYDSVISSNSSNYHSKSEISLRIKESILFGQKNVSKDEADINNPDKSINESLNNNVAVPSKEVITIKSTESYKDLLILRKNKYLNEKLTKFTLKNDPDLQNSLNDNVKKLFADKMKEDLPETEEVTKVSEILSEPETSIKVIEIAEVCDLLVTNQNTFDDQSGQKLEGEDQNVLQAFKSNQNEMTADKAISAISETNYTTENIPQNVGRLLETLQTELDKITVIKDYLNNQDDSTSQHSSETDGINDKYYLSHSDVLKKNLSENEKKLPINEHFIEIDSELLDYMDLIKLFNEKLSRSFLLTDLDMIIFSDLGNLYKRHETVLLGNDDDYRYQSSSKDILTGLNKFGSFRNFQANEIFTSLSNAVDIHIDDEMFMLECKKKCSRLDPNVTEDVLINNSHKVIDFLNELNDSDLEEENLIPSKDNESLKEKTSQEKEISEDNKESDNFVNISLENESEILDKNDGYSLNEADKSDNSSICDLSSWFSEINNRKDFIVQEKISQNVLIEKNNISEIKLEQCRSTEIQEQSKEEIVSEIEEISPEVNKTEEHNFIPNDYISKAYDDNIEENDSKKYILINKCDDSKQNKWYEIVSCFRSSDKDSSYAFDINDKTSLSTISSCSENSNVMIEPVKSNDLSIDIGKNIENEANSDENMQMVEIIDINMSQLSLNSCNYQINRNWDINDVSNKNDKGNNPCFNRSHISTPNNSFEKISLFSDKESFINVNNLNGEKSEDEDIDYSYYKDYGSLSESAVGIWKEFWSQSIRFPLNNIDSCENFSEQIKNKILKNNCYKSDTFLQEIPVIESVPIDYDLDFISNVHLNEFQCREYLSKTPKFRNHEENYPNIKSFVLADLFLCPPLNINQLEFNFLSDINISEATFNSQENLETRSDFALTDDIVENIYKDLNDIRQISENYFKLKESLNKIQFAKQSSILDSSKDLQERFICEENSLLATETDMATTPENKVSLTDVQIEEINTVFYYILTENKTPIEKNTEKLKHNVEEILSSDSLANTNLNFPENNSNNEDNCNFSENTSFHKSSNNYINDLEEALLEDDCTEFQGSNTDCIFSACPNANSLTPALGKNILFFQPFGNDNYQINKSLVRLEFISDTNIVLPIRRSLPNFFSIKKREDLDKFNLHKSEIQCNNLGANSNITVKNVYLNKSLNDNHLNIKVGDSETDSNERISIWKKINNVWTNLGTGITKQPLDEIKNKISENFVFHSNQLLNDVSSQKFVKEVLSVTSNKISSKEITDLKKLIYSKSEKFCENLFKASSKSIMVLTESADEFHTKDNEISDFKINKLLSNLPAVTKRDDVALNFSNNEQQLIQYDNSLGELFKNNLISANNYTEFIDPQTEKTPTSELYRLLGFPCQYLNVERAAEFIEQKFQTSTSFQKLKMEHIDEEELKKRYLDNDQAIEELKSGNTENSKANDEITNKIINLYKSASLFNNFQFNKNNSFDGIETIRKNSQHQWFCLDSESTYSSESYGSGSGTSLVNTALCKQSTNSVCKYTDELKSHLNITDRRKKVKVVKGSENSTICNSVYDSSQYWGEIFKNILLLMESKENETLGEAEKTPIEALITITRKLVNDYGNKEKSEGMLLAIMANDVGKCLYILEKGFDLSTNLEVTRGRQHHKEHLLSPSLHVGCLFRRCAIVKLLLKYGAKVNELDAQGYPPHFLLIGQKFFISCRNNNFYYGFHSYYDKTMTVMSTEEIFHNSQIILSDLLEYNLDINFRDVNGRTALMNAALVKDVITIRILISKGADVFAQDELGKTFLHFLCDKKKMKSKVLDIIEELLSAGYNVNYKDYQGNTPLHYVAKHGNKKAIVILLAWGGNACSLNALKQSPIFEYFNNPTNIDESAGILLVNEANKIQIKNKYDEIPFILTVPPMTPLKEFLLKASENCFSLQRLSRQKIRKILGLKNINSYTYNKFKYPVALKDYIFKIEHAISM